MHIFYYLYALAFLSFLFVAAVGWDENPQMVLLHDNDYDEMEENTEDGTGPILYLLNSLMNAFDYSNGYDHMAMMDKDNLDNFEAIHSAEKGTV